MERIVLCTPPDANRVLMMAKIKKCVALVVPRPSKEHHEITSDDLPQDFPIPVTGTASPCKMTGMALDIQLGLRTIGCPLMLGLPS